jgi:hypothetical protein
MDDKQTGGKENPDYHAYLLRMWRENAGRQSWRASLESAQSGMCKGFASLGELFSFLQRATGLEPDVDPSEDREGRVGRERRR